MIMYNEGLGAPEQGSRIVIFDFLMPNLPLILF